MAEVLKLDLCQLANVVLQLIVLQLPQVLWTQDHVLNQLCNFLVEFGDIRLLVDK